MTEEAIEKLELYNRCRVEKYPYFFRYLYDTAKRDWKRYMEGCNKTGLQRFQKKVADLKAQTSWTDEEKEFLDNFDKYAPLMDSKSPMNMICHHLEDIDFEITKRIKETKDFDYSIYKNPDIEYTEEDYSEITACLEREIKNYNELKKKGVLDEVLIKMKMESIQDKMRYICPNRGMVVNILVDYYYGEKPKSNKDMLFKLYGNVLNNNVIRNEGGRVFFPMRDENGSIVYLGEHFETKEVCVGAI